jgi:O-antigen ligase
MPTTLISERRWELVLIAMSACFGIAAGISPKVAVGIAFGIFFLLLIVADLTIGLCLFTVVAFLDLLPDFGAAALSFAKLVGLVLAISWIAAITTRSRERKGFVAVHPVAAYVALLFVCWIAASTFWAREAGPAHVSLLRYALNVLLFIIVFSAVRERRHFTWVLASYVTAAAASAAYGLLLGSPGTPEADVVRLTGTIGDANELAAVLVAGVWFAFALATSLRRAPIARILALAAGVFCIAGIFLSLSRGGLLALGVTLLAAILFGGRWRAAAAVVGVLLAMVTAGYFVLVASPEARTRVTTLQGGAGRSDIWTIGLRMVKAHPVRGIGVGNFQNTAVSYVLAPGTIRRADLLIEKPKVAHNTYLQVAAELGLVGLALFMFLVLFAIWCALKAAHVFRDKGDARMELLTRGFLVGMIGMLAADFFISEEFSKQLWLILGLAPAILAVAQSSPAVEFSPDAYSLTGRLARWWAAAPSITARTPEPAH